MWILGIFFFAIPGYNLSWKFTFYDKKIVRQILGSPTIWE